MGGCGQQRSRTGSAIRDLYVGPPSHGRLAEQLWDPDGGDGINRRVLDSDLPDFGIEGNRSRAGECTTRQKCKRSQDGYAGLSVVADSAQLWVAGGIVSSRPRHWCAPKLHATSAD